MTSRSIAKLVEALRINITELQLRILVTLRNVANGCDGAEGVDRLLETNALDVMEELMIEGEVHVCSMVLFCSVSLLLARALSLSPLSLLLLLVSHAHNVLYIIYTASHTQGSVQEIAGSFLNGLSQRESDVKKAKKAAAAAKKAALKLGPVIEDLPDDPAEDTLNPHRTP